MAGFRRGQRRGHGLGIAHFAHQDHVRRLPHNAAQRDGEVRRIAAHFDLLDHRTAVRVLVFHRIFNGHHVRRAAGIHDVDERRQRGTLAAAGGTGQQHHSLPLFGQLRQVRRQMQRFQRGNLRRQQPDARRQRAALMVYVDAEAAQAFAKKAEVHGLILV